MDPLIGQMIEGRYEVRAVLGQGGMGTVYRAHQRSVDREVAIKLMDPSYSLDPTAVRRFEREAQLASKLSQPNTVSVFDSGTATDGRLYIAMELIRGRTLHRVLAADGAFSVERAARVVIQICDALDAAHRLGIVHRDLKLDNVMVLDDPPGRDLVKVLDFGLAKQVGELDPRATGTGIVVGTPRYIAPEVAVGGAMTSAADMYAVGAMLAELVLGGALWEGDHLSELIFDKLEPNKAIANVPASIQMLVDQLIPPRPELRPSAAAARDQLAMVALTASTPRHPRDSLGAADTIGARPSRVRRTRRYGTVGLVLAALVGGGLVALYFIQPSAPPPVPPDAVMFHDAPETTEDQVFAAVGSIQVKVLSEPPGADIAIYAKRGPAPFEVRLPKLDELVPVIAHWKRKVAVAMIRLDGDQIVIVREIKPPPNGRIVVHLDCETCPDPDDRMRVQIHIPGADHLAVELDHRKLGTTPIDLEIDRMPDPIALRIGNRLVQLTPDRDQTLAY